MNSYIVDLRSDTLSLPTAAMREAMKDAVVGDDVYGEDPTVLQLETKSAKLFDKEAALFVPSGTMANLLASISCKQSRTVARTNFFLFVVMVHCHQRGAEAIVGDLSHTFLYEQGR